MSTPFERSCGGGVLMGSPRASHPIDQWAYVFGNWSEVFELVQVRHFSVCFRTLPYFLQCVVAQAQVPE